MLIESLSDQRFDNSLPAHVQILRGPVQFLQHAGSNIDVHSLNRLNHAAFALEEWRDALSLVSHFRDVFSLSPTQPMATYCSGTSQRLSSQ